MNHDFGQSRIKELEKEIELMKRNVESLIVSAFIIVELRDHWRKKFGLPLQDEINTDIK